MKTLRQYIKAEDAAAFQAVGWRIVGSLEGTHHGFYSDLIIERDMAEADDKRISVVSSNLLESGEVEIIAMIDKKQEALVMSRKVAAALIECLAKSLAGV